MSAEYSFDTLIDRRGTDCAKWDDPPTDLKAPNLLPMWTADMDFACPPQVMEALSSRLEHPIFGYYAMPERYYDSIRCWHRQRFGNILPRESILPVASVLGGVAMAIQALTEPGDTILVPTPGYHAFFAAIANNHRKLVTSPLIREGDQFRMDFEGMEKKITDHSVKLLILCSPHNPTGRIWQEEELTRLVDICVRHHVYLVSDEIHADMTLTHPFTPLTGIRDSRAKEISVSLYAPTKTFNLAGLCTAYAVIPNALIREKFQAAMLASGLKVKNTLGIEALMAAYNSCGGWVDALQQYLLDNAQYAADYIEKNIPSLHAYVPEATYFLWIDFSGTHMEPKDFARRMAEEAHVVITTGEEFMEGGETNFRMVTACPRARLQEALERIKIFLA